MRRSLRMLWRGFRTVTAVTVLAMTIPTAAAAAYYYAKGWPSGWHAADWSSTKTAPDPRSHKEAIILVYAARAGRWRGAFSVHTWIAVKTRNSPRFTRYEVVGWGKPVRRDAWPVDGLWYSNRPRVIREIKGRQAELLIPKIETAIARYPHGNYGNYRVWPGPNSNSFVAWIGREVRGLGLEMPAAAVGKDFIGDGFAWTRTPSGTGWQVSAGGYLGAAVGLKEGFEVHILGTTIGIDPESLGIKLPGLGLLSVHDLRSG